MKTTNKILLPEEVNLAIRTYIEKVERVPLGTILKELKEHKGLIFDTVGPLSLMIRELTAWPGIAFDEEDQVFFYEAGQTPSLIFTDGISAEVPLTEDLELLLPDSPDRHLDEIEFSYESEKDEIES